MIGGMMEVSRGTFAIDRVESLMANGDLVAATIHFVAEREGASLALDGVDLLRVVDGLIVEVWLFGADQDVEDAFWG
jgi:predicted SnoaL-like aldol condensation-catalyzing enzyme